MIPLLEYEKSILLDIHDKSSMLITSDGLSLDLITYCTIKVHCDPHNLVLICNHSVNEAKFIIKKLSTEDEVYPPKLITAETNQKSRELIYRGGSVVFVSSRILVVDLLLERMPVHLVSGIIILRCHNLQSSCQDAFVVRLLRERNPNIFVKSFSDNPIALTSGVINAESIMKDLAIPHLFLWPRFRLEVIDNLKACIPNVEEVKVSMSQAMANCQAALLQLIQGTMRELINSNPIFRNDEFSLENALSSSLERIIALYLDPIWHELNANDRTLINDLSNLRHLLCKLVECDPYTFLKHFETLRQTELESIRGFTKSGNLTIGCSAWLFMDETDKLLNNARIRVYKDGNKKRNAKISIIRDIINDEIINEKEKPSSTFRPKTILILVNRMLISNLLIKFFRGGIKEVEQWLSQPEIEPENEKVESEENVTDSLPPGCYSIDMKTKESIKLIIRIPIPGCGEEGIRSTQDSGGFDPKSRLSYILEVIRPTHIIIFEPKVSWIREIETFTARLPILLAETNSITDEALKDIKLNPVKVYFLVYQDSIEEQKYLNTLRREKDAFEYLINLSTNIVIKNDLYLRPIDQLMDDTSYDLSQTTGISLPPTVLVDVREFRSELPAVLHRNGIKVTPLTLSVADYILSSHIAVERKSVSDLIGSLNNGHLYQQCTAMSRHYLNPILLIEFTLVRTLKSKSKFGKNMESAFSLFQGKHSITNNLVINGQLNIHHLLCRLVLLTIHFSQLRIIWSISPHATAEIFGELKLGRPEPSIDKLPQECSDNLDENNSEPIDFLLRMPGINWKNYLNIVKNVESLKDLTKLSLEKLSNILGQTNAAKELYAFLHEEYTPITLSKISSSGETIGFQVIDKPKMHLAGKSKRKMKYQQLDSKNQTKLKFSE